MKFCELFHQLNLFGRKILLSIGMRNRDGLKDEYYVWALL